jgi:hypothetical protein
MRRLRWTVLWRGMKRSISRREREREVARGRQTDATCWGAHRSFFFFTFYVCSEQHPPPLQLLTASGVLGAAIMILAL